MRRRCSGHGEWSRQTTPPPLLQETPARPPIDAAGQPNVALAPLSAKSVATPMAPPNPEIELSSTDTDDSDSIPANDDGTIHPFIRALIVGS